VKTPSLQFYILILLIATISGPPHAKGDEDTPGVIRSYTFDTTMDKAGDATRQAEIALKYSMDHLEACKGIDPADPVASEKCEQARAERKKFLEETKGIRQTQRIFAHVSRASDVAAVGAIGTVGYQELMKKDTTQSDNLRSVAKIQETAGYVAYTAGAADFSMGAYSFAAHKTRLEKMNELVKKINPSAPLSAEDLNVVTKLTTAAEASKKAAYNHMLYGAGKAAVGYGSMHLAKQNKKIADSLTSLEIPMQYGYAATPTVSNRNPNAPALINNRPEFFVPNTSITSSLQGTPDTGGGGSFGFAGGGASVMSPEGGRTPSSAGGGGLGGGSPSAVGGGGSGSGGSSSSGDSPVAEETAAAPKDPFGSSFELNLMGGGGMGYRGGDSNSSSADSAPADAVTGAFNTASNATGLNPGNIYDEATEDLTGEEQGSMAGISGGKSSLFEVVRAKYLKMAEGGRVQGPGDVEVKSQ